MKNTCLSCVERDNRYFFKMEKQGDDWKINGTQLPGWLVDNESLIVAAIAKEEQS